MSSTDRDTYRLLLTVERLARVLRSTVQDRDLSPAAASALRRLVDEGPAGVTELARRESVSQPAMSQLVNRLVDQNLAERQVDDRDRRTTEITVTDAGLGALEHRRQIRAGQVDRSIASLAADERDILHAAVPVLEKLTQVIQTDVDNRKGRH